MADATTAAGGAAAGAGEAGAGNDRLAEAFDQAIDQAQQTLMTTTTKGADLYALKQRPQ